MGVILAGGAGRRLGGGKPAREVAGRPLAAYAAEAVGAVVDSVAVVSKAGQALPALSGVERWDDEPPEPRHPAMGIVHALDRACGEDVLVCAADMPFVGAAEAGAIVEAASPGRVVVAAMAGQLEPLLGVYPSGTRDALLDGALHGRSMRAVVADLEPLLVELPPRVLRSINTELALTEADRELRQPRSIT